MTYHDQKRNQEHQPTQILIILVLFQGSLLESMGGGRKGRTCLLCLVDDQALISYSYVKTRCKERSGFSPSTSSTWSGKSSSFLLEHSLWLWAPSPRNSLYLYHTLLIPMDRQWLKPSVAWSRPTSSIINHFLFKSPEVSFPFLHTSSLVSGSSQWFSLWFFLHFQAA